MQRTVSLSDFNVSAWEEGDYVREYDREDVRPVEAVLFARHREALGGKVLELGCGAGRLTRVLAGLSDDVTVVDVSERMIDACRAAVPSVHTELGDLRDLTRFDSGSFTALVACDNVLDVLDHQERRVALRSFARVLARGGTLLLSSHNQANIAHLPTPLRRALSSPRDFASTVYRARRLPRQLRNRRFAREFERTAADHAIVNDPVHDSRLAHYFIGRDAQAQQLTLAGFALVECLDADGQVVPAGETAERSPWLHYAAVKR